MTEAQRHQILLEMLAQLGFVTVEKVVERRRNFACHCATRYQ